MRRSRTKVAGTARGRVRGSTGSKNSSSGWERRQLLKVAVLGAAGRMGRAVLSCIAEADDLKLVGAVTEAGDAQLGRDAGELCGGPSAGVPLTDERSQGLHAAQVAIDFTLPAVTEANLRACVEHGAAIVIGTTGLEP